MTHSLQPPVLRPWPYHGIGLPLAGVLALASALAMLLLLLLLCVAPAPAAADTLGAELFNNHCAGCHLNGGNIIRRGKTLRLAALQRNGLDGPAAIAAIAARGQGQMSGYGSVLGDEGVEVVAAYVWQQAQQDWPRG